MKVKLLFLLVFASLSSFAQYTHIPDVNFENKLIALGIDFGVPDGKVLTTNIESLTSLDVSSSFIIDLTGIQEFVALKDLKCEHNQLTKLNVSKNTALHILCCEHNQLTKLNVSKNTALGILNCDWNQITSLNVSKNTALISLGCKSNQLTTLDVSKNTALMSLYCDLNPLTALDVSKNTALYSLACKSTKPLWTESP